MHYINLPLATPQALLVTNSRVSLIRSINRRGEQDYRTHGLASDIIWWNQHVYAHQQNAINL